MDYEEKYKKALKMAKDIKLDIETLKCQMNPDMLEIIFPELAESEDEKIRKAIIGYIDHGQHYGVSNADMLTWLEKQSNKDEEILVLKDKIESLHAAIKLLKETHKIELEKQGEEKTADYISKFHVGDLVVSTKNPHLTYKVLEVGHINENGDPEYKVEIFADGKSDHPSNIKYIRSQMMDVWARLIGQKSWINIEEQPIPCGIDVLAYNKEWINEWTPNGIRIGYLSEEGFVSAKYSTCDEDYVTCREDGDDYDTWQEQSDGSIKTWYNNNGDIKEGYRPNMPTHYLMIPNFNI